MSGMTKVEIVLLLMSCAIVAEVSGSSDIQYIRKDIPHIEIPSYGGQHYEARIPDTFDIQKRMELAINALTSPTDPNADFELYWWVDLFRDPPVMKHDFSDQVQVKFFESLPLLRLAAGSKQNLPIDRAWDEVLLKSLGSDGLFYTPVRGRPWAWDGAAWAMKVWRPDGTYTNPSDPDITQWTSPFLSGRVLSALCVRYLLDPNDVWKNAIIRMVDRLNELAIDKGDWAYLPEGSFEPNAKIDPAVAEPPSGIYAIEGGNGRLIQDLIHAYRAANYQPALKLAGKLTNFIRYHGKYYDKRGRFLLSETEHEWLHKVWNVESPFGGHFHAHTIGLLAFAEYGLAVQDANLLDFVKQSFEWAQTQGSEQIGFFPEMLVPGYPSAESCELADMIAIALKLSGAGVADYWDQADRWIRNHFAESQLTHVECLSNLPKVSRGPVKSNECADQVARRNLGAFAGWTTGNEWVVYHGTDSNGRGVMHCCTGNATRTLYYIWQSILDYNQDSLRVNLLMNRASVWADVNSHLPYTGRVDITVKKPLKGLMLRVPEWIENKSKDVQITVNGKPRAPQWHLRYVDVGPVARDDKVQMVFPVFLQRTTDIIGNVSYNLLWKGNTVIDIEPSGKYCPLYQRQYFRADCAPVIKVPRFIGDKAIVW